MPDALLRGRRTQLILLLIWIVAFAGALFIDRSVAEWVQRAPLFTKHAAFVPILKLPGNYLFTIAVALLLAFFHRDRSRAAIPLLLSGPLVGIGYVLLKWTIGRRRPVLSLAPFDFHPFAHGLHGLLHAESGLAFPSGHASLAFATATCLAAALPRWTVVFFLAAAAVAAERVLENAHYVSDVIAGAGLGVLCGVLALRLTARHDSPTQTAANP